MRILALNWRDIRSPQAGGSEIHLHEILKRMPARGHEVTLVCGQFAGKKGPAFEVVDGVRTYRVGAWWNAHLAVPRFARSLLRREKFDLLVDDVNKIPFFAPAWSPIPVVAFFHHLLGASVFLETNPVFAAAIWLYERQVGSVYRGVPSIVVSPSTACELTDRGLRPRDLVMVPPGLDHTVHRPGGPPKPETPTLLVVSRLKKYKRVDIAIRALSLLRARHPDARLVVVGDGDDRNRLERLARRLRQTVRFVGAVSEAEKVRWMNRAHVLLNPSTKEGWGMVAIEAMACGTPVVASDVPGHRDSVPRGVGFRTQKGDPASMAAAAADLLADPELHREHVRRGIHWASSFSWSQVATEVITHLESASHDSSKSSKSNPSSELPKARPVSVEKVSQP